MRVDGTEGFELGVVLAQPFLGLLGAPVVMGQDNRLVLVRGEIQLAHDLLGRQLLINLQAHDFYSLGATQPGGLGRGEKELAGCFGFERGLGGRQRDTPRARLVGGGSVSSLYLYCKSKTEFVKVEPGPGSEPWRPQDTKTNAMGHWLESIGGAL